MLSLYANSEIYFIYYFFFFTSLYVVVFSLEHRGNLEHWVIEEENEKRVGSCVLVLLL